jgi:hypothetical protein
MKHSKVHKHLSDSFPIQNDQKQRDAVITMAFQLFFAIYQYEGPGKPSGTKIKWDTSASCLC